MTTATDPYRVFGRGYADVRRPDPRIARRLHAALGDATTVINVGAGAGSYEPTDRPVLAVEPSATMLRQRRPGSAPAVRAAAEALPCRDGQFDAALASMTVHHWADLAAGLAELCRVARRQVVFTWDAGVMARHWLISDYLPRIAEAERGLATLDAVVAGLTALGRRITVQTVEIPWDCTDGFLSAYWRRPDRYLDPAVRAGTSPLAAIPDDALAPALARLADDLRTGAWHREHADLLDRDSFDTGCRLVIADSF